MHRIFASLLLFCATFVIAPLAASATPMNGFTQATAGTSALQILTSFPGSPNGIYWIDPNGGSTSDAFLADLDMTTSGGGWTLALASAAGSESPGNDIVATVGTVGLTSGHTRAIAPTLFTSETAAQIRLEISATNGQKFDAYYSGRFHDPLPAFASWTTIFDHTAGAQSLLASDFGQSWSTVGSNSWFFNGSSFSSIPSFAGDATNGPVGPNPGVTISSFRIWVRGDLQTPATVPEPSTAVLGIFACGLMWVLRKRFK